MSFLSESEQNRIDEFEFTKYLMQLLLSEAEPEKNYSPSQKHLLAVLQDLAPRAWKHWSEAGTGYIQNEPKVMMKRVKKVCLCVTPTYESVEWALKNGYDLMVSHHPITAGKYSKKGEGLPIIAAHTSLDRAKKGINMTFARYLGLKNIRLTDDLYAWGEFPTPLTFDQVKEKMNKLMKHTHLKTGGKLEDDKDEKGHASVQGQQYAREGADPLIKTVCICSGGGGFVLGKGKNYDPDKKKGHRNYAQLFITGELSSKVTDANQNFEYVIETGHTNNERVILTFLKIYLKARFPDLQVDFVNREHDTYGAEFYKEYKGYSSYSKYNENPTFSGYGDLWSYKEDDLYAVKKTKPADDDWYWEYDPDLKTTVKKLKKDWDTPAAETKPKWWETTKNTFSEIDKKRIEKAEKEIGWKDPGSSKYKATLKTTFEEWKVNKGSAYSATAVYDYIDELDELKKDDQLDYYSWEHELRTTDMDKYQTSSNIELAEMYREYLNGDSSSKIGDDFDLSVTLKQYLKSMGAAPDSILGWNNYLEELEKLAKKSGHMDFSHWTKKFRSNFPKLSIDKPEVSAEMYRQYLCEKDPDIYWGYDEKKMKVIYDEEVGDIASDEEDSEEDIWEVPPDDREFVGPYAEYQKGVTLDTDFYTFVDSIPDNLYMKAANPETELMPYYIEALEALRPKGAVLFRDFQIEAYSGSEDEAPTSEFDQVEDYRIYLEDEAKDAVWLKDDEKDEPKSNYFSDNFDYWEQKPKDEFDYDYHFPAYQPPPKSNVSPFPAKKTYRTNQELTKDITVNTSLPDWKETLTDDDKEGLKKNKVDANTLYIKKLESLAQENPTAVVYKYWVSRRPAEWQYSTPEEQKIDAYRDYVQRTLSGEDTTNESKKIDMNESFSSSDIEALKKIGFIVQ